MLFRSPLEIQKTLSTEYDYLKKLYKVTPPECINWKTGGIFPKGQIENRILQLGFLLCYFLEQSIFNPDHLYFEKWNEKLKIKLSAILATGTTATLIKFKQDLIPGKEKLKSIYVNLLFPLMEKENPSVFSNFENLNALMSEKNHITLKFEKLGLKAKNLLESQGQTELYENYCRRHLCLRCEIGKKILTINSAA